MTSDNICGLYDAGWTLFRHLLLLMKDSLLSIEIES
jgi:hypothetical protein